MAIPTIVPITVLLACFSRLVQSQATTFWDVFKAHTGASPCPPAPGGTWNPDDKTYICCYTATNFPPNPTFATAATATSVSSQNGWGCCATQYSCTGRLSAIADWSLGFQGNVVSFPYSPAPQTSSSPVTTTPPITTPADLTSVGGSIGTSSGPGATPTSQPGNPTLFYLTSITNNNGCSNSNGNGNGNIQNCGGHVSQNVGRLPGRDIAGIVIGIFGALGTALGVWF